MNSFLAILGPFKESTKSGQLHLGPRCGLETVDAGREVRWLGTQEACADAVGGAALAVTAGTVFLKHLPSLDRQLRRDARWLGNVEVRPGKLRRGFIRRRGARVAGSGLAETGSKQKQSLDQ